MAVFELNQGTHHDHIVCLDCGRVEEFMDAAIEDAPDRRCAATRFHIHDHSLILYGHCQRKNCPSRNPTSGSAQRSLSWPGGAGQPPPQRRPPWPSPAFRGVFARLGTHLDAAEHARQLLHACLAGEPGDAGARVATVGELADAQVLVALGGDLRQMRDAQYLASLPSARSSPPTISATAPPMPASTSSNIMQRGLLAQDTCTASDRRASSPPEATLASARGGEPGLALTRNSI